MRILFIFLIAGLCLVTAKYIPHDASDSHSVLHRVRKSDSQDSDLNTQSIERDDDSSNENDNADSEDNDSVEKRINEERNKIREKEEKNKRKLLEKLEKQKQKEIEEKRKQEEKFAKEQQKVQEKKEKEERKLHERIEKERQKLEEENRKAQLKLEKEGRKRQEKLKKQLEKLQKEHAESDADTYLETEEEDSVEMKDIWKIYVYNKYGINITSTKLERQAALQRYLDEEMSVVANSTKSEQRQAILKLIETKLQNDSAAIDSFKNLLLKHVNTAQMQKLKSKLENDLEELNNQTKLLHNISLPWASVAQQNVEEKRTFLQAITQFISNIVPNWFSGGYSLSNSTQQNGNGIITNSAATANSGVSNNVYGSGQPSQSVTIGAGGESNLSVLPSSISSGSTSNNLSLSSDSLNSNVNVSQINNNEEHSNTSFLANSDSSNALHPANSDIQFNDLSESNGFVGSSSLKNNVTISQVDVNGKILATDNSANSDSINPLQSTDSRPLSSNPPGLNVSATSDLVTNNDDPVSQASDDRLHTDTANAANLHLPNASASYNSESTLESLLKPNEFVGSGSVNINATVDQTDLSGTSFNTSDSANINSSNQSPPAYSGSASSDPSKLSGSAPEVPSESINNHVSVIQNTVNELSLSSGNVISPVLPVTPLSNDLGSPVANLLEPNESAGSGSLNTNIVSETNITGTNSIIENSAHIDSSNPPTSDNSVLISSNPSELNGYAITDTVNNNVSVTQSSINKPASNPADTVYSDLWNKPLSTDFGLIVGNPLEPNESVGSGSVNMNATINQTDLSGTSSNTGDSATINSSNPSPPAYSGSASSDPSKLNVSAPEIHSESINNYVSVSQNTVNELPSSSGNVISPVLPVTPLSSDLGSTVANLLEPNESVDSGTININATVNQTDLSETSSNTGDSANINSSNPSPPAYFESASSYPSKLSGSAHEVPNESINNHVPVSQNTVNELPSSIGNVTSSGLPVTPLSSDLRSTVAYPLEINESTGSGSLNSNIVSQTDRTGTNSIIENSANIDSTNLPIADDSVLIPNYPSETNGSAIIDAVNNNAPIIQTIMNKIASNTTNTVYSDLPNKKSSTDIGLIVENPLEPNETVGNGSLNDTIPANQTDISGITSKIVNLSNVDSLNPLAPTSFEPTSIDPLVLKGFVDSNSINNNAPVDQTNGLPSSTVNRANFDLPNTPISTDSLTTAAIPLEPHESVVSNSINDNVHVDQTGVAATSNSANSANITTVNVSVSSNENSSLISRQSPSIPSRLNKSDDNSSIIDVNNTKIGVLYLANPGLSTVNPSNTSESSVTVFLENNVTVSQIDAVEGKPNYTIPVNSELSNDMLNNSLNLSNNNGTLSDTASGKNEVVLIPAEPVILLSPESLNDSSDSNPLGSEQISADPSYLAVSGPNVSVVNDVGIKSSIPVQTPIENTKANTNISLTFVNGENVTSESILGADSANEAAVTNTNSTNGVLLNTDVTAVNSTSDNTSSTSPVANNDSVLSFGVNDSAVSVTNADMPATSNFEKTTDIISTNTQIIHSNSKSQDRSMTNTEAGINADAIAFTTPVVTTNDITQVEIQTEQGNIFVQEIVNTPSGFVTVASIQAPPPSPPTGVIVPIEQGASILDVRVQ